MSPVVLGGGISGLATAFYLAKSGAKGIRVFESSNRIGGWINSFKTKNGTTFELGPRTLRNEGRNSEVTLQLSEELGLSSLIKPVFKENPVVNKRKLYVNNQLVSLPEGLMSVFKINPPYMKPLMYALWKDYRTAKSVLDDDSVYNFVARRFGEDYAEIPVSALTCGVFGGDSKEISIKALMPDAFRQEQVYGHVFFGALMEAKIKKNLRKETLNWTCWSFENGLQTFPMKLKEYLEEKRKADIFLEKRCSKITFKNGKAVMTIDGKEETTDHLYSALPSRELARILSGQHSFLKTELSSIPFVTVATVNLEFEGDLIEDKCFGFLVPPNQNLPILGIVFDSCIFPQEKKTLLCVMMGGKWFEKHFGSNPEEKHLLEIAQDHVRKILKIDEAPTDSKVSILRNCLPQYIVGHSRRIQNIREYITEKKLPLSLIGNSYDGVGIHDAIWSAKTGVERNIKPSNESDLQ